MTEAYQRDRRGATKPRRKLGITLEAEFRAGDGVGAESEGSPGAIPKSVTSECTDKVKDMKLGFV